VALCQLRNFSLNLHYLTRARVRLCYPNPTNKHEALYATFPSYIKQSFVIGTFQLYKKGQMISKCCVHYTALLTSQSIMYTVF